MYVKCVYISQAEEDQRETTKLQNKANFAWSFKAPALKRTQFPGVPNGAATA